MWRFLLIASFAAGAVFALSFFGARISFAHGEHCGGDNPPCNWDPGFPRYYAAQLGPSRDGIKGSLFVETNNDLKDESRDFVAHFLNLTNYPGYQFTCGGFTSTAEWAQIGITDGYWPDGTVTDTQYVYYEFCNTCPPSTWGGGYRFRPVATTPTWGTYERVRVYRPVGADILCGSTTYQIIYIGRGGTDIDFTMFRSAPDQPSGQTEHNNRHAHEPNSLVCFGTAYTCAPSTTEGLQLYTQSTNTWSLWTSPAPTFLETDNLLYNHVQHANYYSFITHRQ